MPQCRLCRQEHELRNSHIVPEFLYSGFRELGTGHMMGINGLGHKGWMPLKKGIREPLFCEACEQHFNEHCEKPFRKQWCIASPLPNPWNVAEPYWINVEYDSFKLFHLSVLFRASVSSLATYSDVSLGRHEETLRKLLLAKDPGKFWQYPVMGQVVVHHETRAIVDMVSRAERLNRGGHNCYRILSGGVQWSILISSQRYYDFESVSLQADGRFPLHAVIWNEVPLIQAASRALNRVHA